MSKFILGSDENLYMEGYSVYIKSKWKVYQGHARITSKRFVYCAKPPSVFALIGPLIGGMVKWNDIVFEISLAGLISVHKEKQGLGSKYILTQRDGVAFNVGFLLHTQAWMQTLMDAVKKAVPGTTAERIGDRIEFSKAS